MTTTNRLIIVLGLIAAGLTAYQTMLLRQVSNPQPSLSPMPDVSPSATVDKIFYNQSSNYSLRIPSTWKEIEPSADFPTITRLEAPDKSAIEIRVEPMKEASVAAYLKNLDRQSQTGYEGKPSRKILDVQNDPFMIRTEQWLAADFIVRIAYLKIDKQIVTITAQPGLGGDARNTEAGKNFEKIVTSFQITNDNP